MKKFILILIVATSIVSCDRERDDDDTHTKVGFYMNGSSTESVRYNLYMDGIFVGKIREVGSEPACGDSSLLYITIDSKKHQMEVKDDAGKLLNAEYLQIGSSKCGSGSGKNSHKVDGAHGSSMSKKTGDDCATMGFTR